MWLLPHLGEINDQQEGAWRKSLDVFDDERQSSRSLSLFPEDREIPADAVDSLQVKLSQLQLRRARPFGNCWLACDLWRNAKAQLTRIHALKWMRRWNTFTSKPKRAIRFRFHYAAL